MFQFLSLAAAVLPPRMFAVLLQAGGVSGKLGEIYKKVIPWLNWIVIIAALIGCGRAAFKFFQGDSDAGKMLIGILIGLGIWFGAQALVGEFTTGAR